MDELNKKEIAKELKMFLGKEGIEFFRETKETYGEIAAVWNEGGIPHSVHFREGMQVRNFLRTLDRFKGWSGVDLDDIWVEFVEEAIK